LCFPIQMTQELTHQTPCATHTLLRRIWLRRQNSVFP
jgi:hypothetical protein